MRIDGPSSRSYPIKRKPRKSPATLEGTFEEVDSDIEQPQPQRSARSSRRESSEVPTPNVPARPQDMIFPRSMSSRVATALASYLTTASFVDWEMDVAELDLHV